jgi:sterol 3beta-glucosyltransferase
MAPDEDLKKRVARKLTKRRKEGHQATMEIPERFRDGDDADEDCTATHGTNGYMNQSVFGMIAAAGSQVDFNSRFDAQSSDEEDDSGEPSTQSSDLQVNKTRKGRPPPSLKPERNHRRKFSESKLIRSLSGLGSRSKSRSSQKRTDPLGSEEPSEPLKPQIKEPRLQPKDAPVMSRMLEARAELSLRPSFDMPRTRESGKEVGENGEPVSSSLAQRLMEIFQFEKAEEVIEGRIYQSVCITRY